MLKKLLHIILPVIVGFIVVLTILFLVNFLFFNKSISFEMPDRFFTRFIPFAFLCAVSIQLALVNPIINKYKKSHRFIGLTLFQLTLIVSFISGVLFGLVFWERDLGFSELFAVSLTGISAFFLYWTVNLLIMKTFR